MRISPSGRPTPALTLGPVLLASLLAGLLAVPAQAALYASLDRYRISLGDTVRLTLRSDDDSDPGDADLSGLREHFDVLQRSSSVSTRIINGERNQSRELLLEITPRAEGSFVIPAFTVDGKRSEALAVEVGPEPQSQAADEVVTFEAEIDRENLYVQGQLLLTLRVQQAVNLEARSISELEISNAYVETLGQNSFQRMIDGRPWLVHEIRYAIFPEASGELLIPAQTFSGRMGSGRRTLFDTRPAGRLIRRRTDELRIEVKPRPDAFPDATWLPAADLRIEEQWSAPLDELRVGDSVTRIITVTAEGLQGAQLPPVELEVMEGLRVYPDQPDINNVSTDGGVTGVRSDALALVAVADGSYELPAVEIPWWDTGSNTLRIARLPARRLRVEADIVSPPTGVDATAEVTNLPVASPATPGVWPWLTALCALGWLATALLWWSRSRTAATTATTPTERRSPKPLLEACNANDAPRARRELQAWVRGQGFHGNLGAWLRVCASGELNAAVNELDAALYREATAREWDGKGLAEALRTAAQPKPKHSGADDLPPLYLGQ